jgi:Plasmid pRiA4b ORF-3-like protein
MYFDKQPIIQDFNRFVDYISDKTSLELTKTGANLRAVDLLALNERMHQPVLIEKNKPKQRDFVLLTTLYYIGLAAELWWIRRDPKGAFHLVPQPERISIYDRMTDDERYGFLLQTFWCYFDMETAFDDRSFYIIKEFYKVISKFKVGQPTKIPIGQQYATKYPTLILSALGMFDFSMDESNTSSLYYYVTTATLTDVGKKMLPLLMSDKSHFTWECLDPRMTKDRWTKIYGKTKDMDKLPEFADFFAEFRSVYPEWKVETRLFPIKQPVMKGTFTFKIALSPKCYRVIAIHSEAALEDLHLAIQDVFDFGNDHLYAFYLNGRQMYKAGNVFSDPRAQGDSDEYPADLLSIGELGLYVGQPILYIFDFGDCWTFNIEMQGFFPSDDKPDGDYELLKSVGEAPDQYPDWEEED